jgi:cytochrome P450
MGVAVATSVKQRIVEPAVVRIVEPAILRFCAWWGDPVAKIMQPQAVDNPYPVYDELRECGPLVRSPLGLWTASHATVEGILRDRRFGVSPVHENAYRPLVYDPDDPRAELPQEDLLTLDPPDHTRLRRLVASAFTPRAIAALEPWIRDKVRQLADQAEAAGSFDLIEAVAFPLPMAVICHLLGVPAEDQDKFRDWGHDLAATLEMRIDPATERRARESEPALAAYLKHLAAAHRTDPDNSLFSALVAAEEEGGRLSMGELVRTALLLLVAGFETTVNLIGNGTVALLSEPNQWTRLHEDPALVPCAVEELLRYDSPVQVTSRIATEDVQVGSTMLKRGTRVELALAGANRDPAMFDEPNRLKIDRAQASRHVAFALGIHTCLGASLARLEARVAFEELSRRFPGLQLDGTPVRRPTFALRGYERVPVRVGKPGTDSSQPGIR